MIRAHSSVIHVVTKRIKKIILSGYKWHCRISACTTAKGWWWRVRIFFARCIMPHLQSIWIVVKPFTVPILSTLLWSKQVRIPRLISECTNFLYRMHCHKLHQNACIPKHKFYCFTQSRRRLSYSANPVKNNQAQVKQLLLLNPQK